MPSGVMRMLLPLAAPMPTGNTHAPVHVAAITAPDCISAIVARPQTTLEQEQRRSRRVSGTGTGAGAGAEQRRSRRQERQQQRQEHQQHQ
jgi:hypothetical protein